MHNQTLTQVMAELLEISEKSVYRWKTKDHIKLMSFLEKYFTKEDIEEFLATGSIEKIKVLPYINQTYNDLFGDIQSLDSIQRKMLHNIIDDFFKDKKLKKNIEEFIFFIRKNDLESYFPTKYATEQLEIVKQNYNIQNIEAIKKLDEIMNESHITIIKDLLDFLFQLKELELLLLLNHYIKLTKNMKENTGIKIPQHELSEVFALNI